jgi:hypothetical protein
MNKARDVRDGNFKVSRPINRIRERGDKGDTYFEGVVVTPFGIVDCLSQGSDRSFHYTKIDFAIDGRCYSKTLYKRCGKISLARMAVKFAKEIAG